MFNAYLNGTLAREESSMNGTDEERLAALGQEAKRLYLCEFWSEVKALERREPGPVWSPHVWSYEEIYPRLLEAGAVVPLDQAERRAVVFRNPAFPERIATTSTLYAAYSLYNGGEKATVHRHTANAARIALAGEGGYTSVEGTKFLLSRGDVVLTPTWTWHDHGNDGKDVNVWFDILDVPLMVHLNGLFFDFDYRDAPGAGLRRYQTPKRTVRGHQQTYFYPWSATCEALQARRNEPVDRHDGVAVHLTDPTTGGSVMPTIDIVANLLPRDVRTDESRTSCNTIVLVMEGSGYTQIEDRRLEWKTHDVLCIPNWRWHQHVNTGGGDAFLYTMTDKPVMQGVNAFRRQGRTPAGDIITLA
jgi:gentisate 1,2-dioxygenase